MWIPRTLPPLAGNPGDSDRVYLAHTGASDSLILTHSGDIWQKHFNRGEFWPQFEIIVAYFLPFSSTSCQSPPTHSWIFWQKIVFFYFLNFQQGLVYYTHPGAIWHKKSIYTHGQKFIYDKEFFTNRGESDNTFSQMWEYPGYAHGGSLGIHID